MQSDFISNITTIITMYHHESSSMIYLCEKNHHIIPATFTESRSPWSTRIVFGDKKVEFIRTKARFASVGRSMDLSRLTIQKSGRERK